MGMIYKLSCETCNKDTDLFLGCGYFSMTYKFAKSIYVCSKCGFYETADIDISKLSFEERTKMYERLYKEDEFAKDIIKGITDLDKNKKCPECNNPMKAYGDLKLENQSVYPKITCKDCKSELKVRSGGHWD